MHDEPPAPCPVPPLSPSSPRRRVLHGHVPPLGVHVTDRGIDVAVLASHADGVDLCLIDVVDPSLPEHDSARYRERRVPLDGPTYGVWHAHVPDVTEGQRYGFRVHGPWDPAAGLRHNPAKLLVDPYARGIVGEMDHSPAVHGHETTVSPTGAIVGDPLGDADARDSLAHVPHSVVVARRHDLPVRRPHVPWADTVIYEAHVRGLTRRLEALPAELRGTYAGLAHPVTIEHLRSLGITTVELLPIHAFTSEPHLVDKGLTNYWGYSTLGFFAPHAAYATRAARDAGPGAVLDEVRGMVHLLHEAGIEVLLDVVHNHTCEGGVDGPHVSWRGLDNPVYYLHDGASPARLADVTGCGNSLDFRRPRVVQHVLDSLRYWADEIGVDGFRFDLAVTYGRGPGGFDPHHPFLVALQTDPSLNGLKLVAEPWDLGPGGWRTGQFPAPMAEWNDRFRDAARQFWLADAREASHGRPGQGVRDLATRLAGSADMFGHSDPPLMRGPVASVNFVTAHDGFTLTDLVAYDHKHNEANGEGNRDGTDNNRSWNHGFEGRLGAVATGDDQLLTPGAEIAPLRRRSIRNLLATLIFAAGTPMITAGDEMGRTQDGNNNAYAQDNAVSWLSWEPRPWQRDMLATTRHLLALRREHPALRPDTFFHGRPRVVGARAGEPSWVGASAGVGESAGAAASAGAASAGAGGSPACGAASGASGAPGAEPGPPGAGAVRDVAAAQGPAPSGAATDPREAVPDLAWFGVDGRVLDHDAWHDPATRTLQMLRTAPVEGARDVLLVLNGSLDSTGVTLAGVRPDRIGWQLAWDSAWAAPDDRTTANGDTVAGGIVEVEALSVQVYLSENPPVP